MSFIRGLWGLNQRIIFQVHNPNRLRLSTAIVAPFWIPKGYRCVSYVIPIIGQITKRGLRYRQFCFFAPLSTDGIKVINHCRNTHPSRTKQHLFAVRCPTLNNIRIGMKGQTFRFTPLSIDDKNIGIAIVLRRKSNHFAIWRKMRKTFRPFMTRQSFGIAAFSVH